MVMTTPRWFLTVLGFVALLLSGCAAPPPVVVHASASATEPPRIWVGSALTGPIPSESESFEAAPTQSAVVLVEVIYDAPEFDLPALASDSHPIANPRLESRRLPVGRLSRGVRLVPTEQLDTLRTGIRGRPVDTETLAFWPGVSTAVRYTNDPAHPLSLDQDHWHTVELIGSVTADEPDTVHFALLFVGHYASSSPEVEGEAAEELIPIDLPDGAAEAGGDFGIWIPIPASNDDALLLTVRPGSASEIDSSNLDALRERVELPPAEKRDLTVWREYETAIDGLRWKATQRRSLANLAQLTGAALARDVALAAPNAFLLELCPDVYARLNAAEPPTDEAALGYLVERATYGAIGARLDRNVPPPVEAVLVQHAGQAGRFSASIDEVFSIARSLKDLPRVLAEENFIFLQDTNPAARARALEWLRRRNLAPEGFDPLAPAAERRRILRDAMERWSPTEGMTPPPPKETPPPTPSPPTTPAPTTATAGERGSA